jgi:hypothetical protein
MGFEPFFQISDLAELKLFLSLTWLGNEAYISGSSFPANISLGCKGLPGTNTLAYLMNGISLQY